MKTMDCRVKPGNDGVDGPLRQQPARLVGVIRTSKGAVHDED
jgi:hypothetical protein